ncbi:MAG TPA: hypothetical protein VMS30_05715 [Phycisphaerales bacterium]|nr:hypothetical protein [Phycisphaerales bacterium]
MHVPRLSPDPADTFDTLVPRRWAHATVSASMHCRNCGYDLRGLDASSRCPECGLDIWMTVVHTVDPTSSRLPSLRNPVAVGNALVLLTVCMFIGALLMVVPEIAGALSELQRGGARAGNIHWWDRLPSLDWQYALLLLIAGGWAVWSLAPPRGSEPHGPVWDDIWRVLVGYGGWIACASMLARLSETQADSQRHPRLVLAIAAGVFAIIGLYGLRGAFHVIGQRSREYRRMQGGRQSVGLIMPAIAAAVIGAVIAQLTRFEWFPGSWRYGVHTIGRVLTASSMLMVLIGLAYLVVNAWSIRRALRRPPPALDEVLLPRIPNETWLPDRED